MSGIILCMIVKNEAHVMERCLTHASRVIDADCICDTGSTDGTPEVTARILDELQLPHRICRHEWQDFGHNRTRAFHEACAFAAELGWDLSRSYALTLDADFVLGVSDAFDRGQLTADGYRVRWIHHSLVYDNMALMRLDLDWRCVGAAHEYWTAGNAAIEKLESMWFEHLDDGGNAEAEGEGGTTKAERYLRLLQRDYEARPDDTRTQFYLAQTYFDLGRYAEAREVYQQRIESGGWDEERWYARYRAALCAQRLGQRQSAQGELLQAWNERPGRAEPLYELARGAREAGEYHTAYLAAEQALALGFPVHDRLFVNTLAYTYGPIEEISISAYYVGKLERGARACDALLHRREVPEAFRSQAARNAVFYAAPLFDHATAGRVEIPTTGGGPGSLQRSRDGYLLVNQLAGHAASRDVDTPTSGSPGEAGARTLLATRLDRDLRARSSTEAAPAPNLNSSPGGLEDPRIIRWRGASWFVAHAPGAAGAGECQVVLGRLNSAATGIEHAVPLRQGQERVTERDWMPLVHDGRLYLFRPGSTAIVLEPDPGSGDCRVVASSVAPANLDRYRGSTPLIPFNGRLLGVVHEGSCSADSQTNLHRFIILDPRTWAVTHVTRPFIFLRRGGERCGGLTWAHEEHELLISFSLGGDETWAGRIHRERIREMLLPVEDLTVIWPLAGLGPEMAGAPASGVSSESARPRRRRLWARPRLRGSGSG